MSNIIIAGKQFNNINKVTFDTPDGSVATYILQEAEQPEVIDPADILYFKPHSTYLAQYPNIVRFALWAYDGTDNWFSFERIGESEYFKINNVRNFLINQCELFIIVNLTGSSTEDNWYNSTGIQSTPIYISNYRNQLVSNNTLVQNYTGREWTPSFTNYTE